MNGYIVFELVGFVEVARFEGGRQSASDILEANGYSDESYDCAVFEIADNESLSDYVIDGAGNPSLSAAGQLEKAKKIKAAELSASFLGSEKSAVIFQTKQYLGGRDSAIAMKQSYDFSIMSGAVTVDLTDINDDLVTLSLADAVTLILMVAGTAKADYFNLKLKSKAVKDSVDQASLDAITW